MPGTTFDGVAPGAPCYQVAGRWPKKVSTLASMRVRNVDSSFSQMSGEGDLTVAQASEALGTSPQTLRTMLRKGQLRGEQQPWGGPAPVTTQMIPSGCGTREPSGVPYAACGMPTLNWPIFWGPPYEPCDSRSCEICSAIVLRNPSGTHGGPSAVLLEEREPLRNSPAGEAKTEGEW